MKEDSEEYRLLEIYKLHADLADRVSQRREGANRLYVTLQVGMLVFVGALLRFGFGDAPEQLVLGVIGGLGVLLSISWLAVIRSYKQLNSEKFRVLHELEKQLPFQFFTLEWDPKAVGKKSNRYWKLTHVEVSVPFSFLVLFLALIAYSICK